MDIQVYNSLTKSKAPLVPLVDNHVRLYVCGMTVYDYNHIGHARSMIVFDVIVRYLRYRGVKVTYVRNITDIDDKIINRAQENDEPVNDLTARFIDALHEDERALNVLSPDHEPRATEYIETIIELIQTLIDNDIAYVADNGDVYFSVERFDEYGKLSHRDIDSLIAGARVEISEAKQAPLDFVLWKMAKPGEPQWSSPWGEGRPGWHIECSAMSTKLLGQPFDIHGGGMDLKFPHHENEIAQSEAAHKKQFANVWMHVGLLQINDEKMSKSLGNFFTIREVLDEHDAEVIRYFMISGHYRSPVNFTQDTLQQIRTSLEHLYIALRGLSEAEPNAGDFAARFYAAMDDDFNTPDALAVIFDMAHEINRLREGGQLEAAAALGAAMREFGSLFAILQQDPDAFLQGELQTDQVEKIDTLIAAREQARAEKDWGESDRIRDELTAMGVVLEDTPDGTVWRKE